MQAIADSLSREITAEDIWAAFCRTYYIVHAQALELIELRESSPRQSASERVFSGRIMRGGIEVSILDRGNGLVSAAIVAVADQFGVDLEVIDYHEHALKKGADAMAAAYIQCTDSTGSHVFGVGIDTDVAMASIKAVLSAASAVHQGCP
ncbi:alpha-isopropylmalate synthase regulatory domain-containing protein [Phyllobacterium sp. 22229]|uniref:alpha-isopropylmalate synthase regulatory domain-containing protein n=1 Tax=Phyllobacterium sp. 22229 TaxID=3453895 RepID=UPI003F87373D